MVLDLQESGDVLDFQRDVRETPASTATASAVGLTNPTYVTLSTDSDLVNERVLTAGEGIDFTDGGAGSTLTVLGEDATTANKGIASFNSAHFSVSSGAVSLVADGIDDTLIDWGTGAGQVSLDDVPDGTSYERVAAAELSSGIYKDATTSVKGIASFNTNDFTVASGAVSVKYKQFWVPANASTESTGPSNTVYGDFGGIRCNEGAVDNDEGATSFVMPPDYNSLTAAVAVCIKITANSTDYQVYVSGGAAGESYGTHSANTTGSFTGSAGNLCEADISGLFTNIAANDYVGVRIDNTDATSGDDFIFLGVRIRYT